MQMQTIRSLALSRDLLSLLSVSLAKTYREPLLRVSNSPWTASGKYVVMCSTKEESEQRAQRDQ